MARSVPKRQLEALAALPLFASCSDKELKSLASLGTPVKVEADYSFMREGRAGAEFFVVLSGTAACTVAGREVAHFGAGDFFGEMALVDRKPRSATVTAETAMEVLVFDAREFGGMLAESPSAGRKIMAEISTRLRSAQGPPGT